MNFRERLGTTVARWRLGTKLTVSAALAVAISVLAVSGVVYVVVRGQLRGQIDQTLTDLASQVEPEVNPISGSFAIELETGPLAGVRGYAQFIDEDGFIPPPPTETDVPFPEEHTVVTRVEPVIPVNERAQNVVSGTEDAYFEDIDIEGVHARVYTAPVVPGVAVQVARPLDEVDETLTRLGWVLLVLYLIAVGVAAGLGRLVARAALSPIGKLSDAAEHVSATTDLTRRIDVTGQDELGRLANQFNAMLRALETSVNAQRQLVGDVSHELRTPITSIRTNLEVLQRAGDMSAQEREQILDQAVEQMDELSILVNDLIEIVRGSSVEEPIEEIRLDEVVADVLSRRSSLADDVDFEVAYEPTTVMGARRRVERAVSNLVDNAVKWSPKPGVIEISVGGGEVCVRDHGPGIDPTDRPRVFDRFYRAPAARSLPGFGLGLAIVKDVADAYGGSVTVDEAAGGGASVSLRLLAPS